MKIVVCGPTNSGKTSIANFLCGNSPTLGTRSKQYTPTEGVRILESECNGIEVELWDVSGSQSYEKCWPAIMQPKDGGGGKDENGVDGVILVYNPQIATHDTEVGLWYDQFVKNAGISDKKTLVFIQRTQPDAAFRSRVPPKLEKCTCLETTFDSAGEVREGFEEFLRRVDEGRGFGGAMGSRRK